MLDGKRVLVTGATGSLGKALLMRAKENNWNVDFVIFSRDETKQGKLKQQYPEYRYVLGDVAKYNDVKRAMRGVDLVFHFAAYKQVPSAQNNVPATIETNVIGSQNVVDAAVECGVEKVVASSTDKACQSVNVYGQSKAVMEAIFQHGNTLGDTTFHLARYGNVICSNSSVIPLFEKQAKEGGPLTVTHQDMTRFWISLDRAVDLVLHALNQTPGTIVVPKAGAMSVYEVAKAVANMYFDTTIDVTGDSKYYKFTLPVTSEIKITGIRAGEKIHEAMVSDAESFYVHQDEEHFYINPPTSEVINHDYFSYTSDIAPKLTSYDMQEAILNYHRKYD